MRENKAEIVKKGWNFGPLPVVGWDSDLGFQYGACVDIFNFGDGSNYPSYNYKMNIEASTYTGGSSLLRCYGDFKTLIPDGKLFGLLLGGDEDVQCADVVALFQSLRGAGELGEEVVIQSAVCHHLNHLMHIIEQYGLKVNRMFCSKICFARVM